jgi:translation initiation factor 1 (eIF-1/SUI1)
MPSVNSFASPEIRSLLLPAWKCLHYEEVLRLDSTVSQWIRDVINNGSVSGTGTGTSELVFSGGNKTIVEKYFFQHSTKSTTDLYVKSPTHQNLLDFLRQFCNQNHILSGKKSIDVKKLSHGLSCLLYRLNAKFGEKMATQQEKRKQNAKKDVKNQTNDGVKVKELGGGEGDDYLDLEGFSDDEEGGAGISGDFYNVSTENSSSFPSLSAATASSSQQTNKGNTPKPPQQQHNTNSSSSNTNNIPLPPHFNLSIEQFTRLLLQPSGNGTKSCHRILELSALNEISIKVKESQSPKIRIRTEKRMNHNCTIIYGLHLYKLDLQKCLEYFKAKVSGSAGHIIDINNPNGGASTTTQTDSEKQEILLQGFFDADICKLLVEGFRIPSKSVENMAEGRKKDMKQKVGGHTKGRVGVVRG